MPHHQQQCPSSSLFFSKPPFRFHKIRRRKKQSMAKTKKKKTFMTSLLSKPTQFLCYPPPLAAWPWPSCKHPKTSSFRTSHVGDSVYKTVNSVYDSISDSSFTYTSEVERAPSNVDVRSIRSDRLFFEPPGSTSSSIIQKSAPTKQAKDSGPFKESIVLTVDSADPYKDFRESMQEMVAAHGIKDWEGLEKLLGMYLRLNAKSTHGLIVGAFVDLLVAMAANSAASPSSCSCITFDDIGEMVEQFG
ncbi:hypothetical protein LUZ63_004777 [Rhynchospora breviuscula]|uniref:Transcription repressor n=1 Tax=Rhynchospora breviuscula TaxID=2022672 RepID=A0A9Q0CLR2_9POAL|nr:hypothetical protein LUZ63_004777 [Rhynchospora breviuscula]